MHARSSSSPRGGAYFASAPRWPVGHRRRSPRRPTCLQVGSECVCRSGRASCRTFDHSQSLLWRQEAILERIEAPLDARESIRGAGSLAQSCRHQSIETRDYQLLAFDQTLLAFDQSPLNPLYGFKTVVHELEEPRRRFHCRFDSSKASIRVSLHGL